MTICVYNVRTLGPEAAIEDLMMQARKIKYDAIRATETRRCHPLKASETGEELLPGTWDSRGVGGVSVLVNTTPTSSYEEKEVEAFYMDLEKFYREDHAFYNVIIGDFNVTIGPRRRLEQLHIGTHGPQWNEQGELSEFVMTTKTTIRTSNSRTVPLYAGEDSAMDSIDGEYDRVVEHLQDCTRKAASCKTTKTRPSLETLEAIS
ncbi:hypothetical protein RB195_011623 [Necator americanus]|uniref:Endonuclease/exonuclease/phosphatase domain-containing protein n=1 Tax=Necator americanus TaxID=51031 RepID=A0ABR1D3A4_NECAM